MPDTLIRARDDPEGVQVLWGFWEGPTEASRRFAADNWARGSYAEFVRAPLENS